MNLATLTTCRNATLSSKHLKERPSLKCLLIHPINFLRLDQMHLSSTKWCKILSGNSVGCLLPLILNRIFGWVLCSIVHLRSSQALQVIGMIKYISQLGRSISLYGHLFLASSHFVQYFSGCDDSVFVISALAFAIVSVGYISSLSCTCIFWVATDQPRNFWLVWVHILTDVAILGVANCRETTLIRDRNVSMLLRTQLLRH